MKWDNLSIRDKADLISLFVKNGITDLGTMSTIYNNHNLTENNNNNNKFLLGGDINNPGANKDESIKYGTGYYVMEDAHKNFISSIPTSTFRPSVYSRFTPSIRETSTPISSQDDIVPYSNEQAYNQALVEKAEEQRIQEFIKENPLLFNDEELALRQRYAESSFIDDLNSSAGAAGAYGIMPINQNWYNEVHKTTGDIKDPEYNRQIRDFLMKHFTGYSFYKEKMPDIMKVAKLYAAYNWSPVKLNKYLKEQREKGIDINYSWDWLESLPQETRDYVNFIVRGLDVGKHKNQKVYERALERFRQSGRK